MLEINLSKNQIVYYLVVIALLLGVLAPFTFIISQNFNKFSNQDYWKRFPDLKRTYENSQYRIPNLQNWIPDETIYAYAGGEFLKGTNPVYGGVVHDHPPLGKYIISFSILVFGNEHAVVPIFFIISLASLFLLSFHVLNKNSILALIPLLFFSFEPLMKNQLIYTPLLDIFQLSFILLSLFFFAHGVKNQKSLWFILAGVSLGAVISIKFLATGLFIVLSWALMTFLKRNLSILVYFLVSIFASLSILYLSYWRYLLDGGSFKGVLAIQKYIFSYQQGKIAIPSASWMLILFNRWYTLGTIKQDPQWWVGWPILTIFSLTLSLFGLKNLKIIRENDYLLMVIIWFFVYGIALSLSQPSARFLVPFFPVTYILFTYFLKFAKDRFLATYENSIRRHST